MVGGPGIGERGEPWIFPNDSLGGVAALVVMDGKQAGDGQEVAEWLLVYEGRSPADRDEYFGRRQVREAQGAGVAAHAITEPTSFMDFADLL